ncbi:MAG: DUF5110 domain-containing protein [Gammaproteobacteria bacterium]
MPRSEILAGVTEIWVGAIGSALPDLDAITSGLIDMRSVGTDAIQSLTLDTPASGTFTITYYDDNGVAYTTTDIAYDADAATIELAIEALSAIGTGGCSVTGTDPFVMTFDGDADQTVRTENMPHTLMVIDGTLLVDAGAEAITETTAGVQGWVFGGWTEAGVVWTHTHEYEEKFVDNAMGAVRLIPVKETSKFETQIAIRSLDAYSRAIAASSVATTSQASGQTAKKVLTVGTITPVEKQLVMIGLNPTGLQRLWHASQGIFNGEIVDTWNKSANNLPTMYTALEDPDDAVGSITRYIAIHDITGYALA